MSDLEVEMILASVVILPAVAILTIAFFNGNFRRTEDTKYVVFIEDEDDYWAQPDTHVWQAAAAAGDSGPAALRTVGGGGAS